MKIGDDVCEKEGFHMSSPALPLATPDLSPAQIERLVLVCEEAFEVIKAFEDGQKEAICVEILDLLAVSDLLVRAEGFKLPTPVLPVSGDFRSNMVRTCTMLGKVSAKALRNGFTGRHPDGGPDNGESLAAVVGFLHAYAAGMHAKMFEIPLCSHADMRATITKKSRFLHRQGMATARYLEGSI